LPDVVTLSNQLAEFCYRIPGGASRDSRVNVFHSRFKYESDRCQSAQAVRDGRLPASDPDRVRHSNRIGFEVFGLPFKEVLEIRTADFLFQFPDKLNIYGSTVFNGVSRPEQSRKCRTFVVGCSPPDIPVPVFMEYKRSTPPLRLVCRLDVEVVVDGNGWP